MGGSWRSSSLFVAGGLLGGAAVLAAYLGWFGPDVQGLPARTFAGVTQPAPQAVPVAAASPSRQPAPGTCPSQPLTQATGEHDGQFMLEAALAPASPTHSSAFATVAREAAEQGRVRDAEVALMAACRAAEQSSGAESAPVAEVKSQMGQHYVLLAAQEGSEEAREGLLQRASSLFAESVHAYAVALGKNASKTRMAQQRLASLRESQTLQAALREGPASGTEVMGAPRSSLAGAGAADHATGSSAGLIHGDPELAQMESDLQRLRAQARQVSRDPGGMSRREAQALAQRDARCHDRACLRQWFAQRRRQLLAEF